MKQIVQWPDSGDVEVLDVPEPQAAPGRVIVRNAASAISPGTERGMVEFGSSSLLSKARSRPDLVRRALEKSRSEGIWSTLGAVRQRLKEPTRLGYSSAGEVIAVGDGVSAIRVGDRVACGGVGFATHAEVIAVPARLVAGVPDEVCLDAAAFTVISTIPLHGFRLSEASLSDTVVVLGLGLVGQIAAQIAAGAGCRVVGFDPNPERCALAETFAGVSATSNPEAVESIVGSVTHGIGADAVLICAATASSEPIAMAARIARDRARVIMVGATGMEVPRRLFFEKELTFLVSRSYGPGRYDPDYEERGKDYPAGFVRWTEGRNMDAALTMMERGSLRIGPLISRIATPDDALGLYREPARLSSELGVLIRYEPPEAKDRARESAATVDRSGLGRVSRGEPFTLGVVGAGQFAQSILLPAIKRAGGFRLKTVMSARGTSAAAAKRQFGFAHAATSIEDVLSDPEIGTVVIATRHDLHARQVVAALEAGKNVFVEKPLALNEEELATVADAARRSPGLVFVGYNRRFSGLVRELKGFIGDTAEPGVLTYRVNAGFIPSSHWIQSAEEGGGRIIGEVCHFVDLLIHLTGELPVSVSVSLMPDNGRYSSDNFVANLEFSGGSVGSISYVACGDRAAGKERIEVFRGGRVAELDDFRRVRLAADGRLKTRRSRLRQDKGHEGEWTAIHEALREGAPPIPISQLLGGALCTYAMVDAARTRRCTAVGEILDAV